MVVFLSVFWASLPYIGWLSLPSPLPCQTIKSAIDHLHLHLEDWLPADLCPPEDILWSKKLLVRFLFTGTALTTSPVSILRPNRVSLCHPWLKTQCVQSTVRSHTLQNKHCYPELFVAPRVLSQGWHRLKRFGLNMDRGEVVSAVPVKRNRSRSFFDQTISSGGQRSAGSQS